MSIRIFELAKQLSQESKNIIAACKALGLRGEKKFYIFTSLNEDEERRVVEYITGQNKTAAPAGRGATKQFVEEDKSFIPQPPKPTFQPGKIRIIQPARGRLSEVDPTVRTHVDVVSTNTPFVPIPPVPEPTPEIAPVVPVSSEPTSATTPARIDPEVEPEERAQSSNPDEVQSNSTNEVVDAPATVEPTSSEETQNDVSDASTSGEETQPAHEIEQISVGSDSAQGAEGYAVNQEDSTAAQVDVEPTVDQSTPIVVEPQPQSDSRESEGQAPATAAVTVEAEPVAEGGPSDAEKDKDKKAQDAETAKRESVSSGKDDEQATNIARKPPLHDVLSRRDGANSGSQASTKNDSRNNSKRPRERDFNGRKGRNPEPPKPTRPAPVTSSFISQLEHDAQAMSAMAPPPPMASQSSSRVRVLGQPQRKKDDANASAPSSKPNGNKGHEVAVHLAPMPTQPVKAPKVEKEPVAQKPEARLSAEALRAVANGGAVSGPLMKHLRSATDRSTGNATGAKTDRRDGNGRGDAKFGRAELAEERDRNEKGKKKSGRDRDDSGSRGNKTRRSGNDQMRYRVGSGDEEDDRYSSRTGSRSRRDKTARTVVTAPRKNDVVIELPCTSRQFAEATGLSVAAIIKKLMEFEVLAPQNSPLDVDVINLLIDAFELKATIKKEATLEEMYVDSAYDQEDPPETLKPRAPVVTFLGHVDHGKTSLLDRILNLHVVSGESGGITQHIRAYQIVTAGGPVTFVDTPGHEAFTAMRARGANCTDIAVLVVAADDGVMPQTEEAISHAKAAGVPIVVALNKMDLPGVNPDKVVQELASNDLMPSEWGGDVEIVHTSAITGMGVDKLLETLLLVAELHELKANPDRPAMGVVLESSLQQGEGVLCKALVQKGTLRRGDVVLCGSSYGRVRAMNDTTSPNKRIKEAGPSCPVTISGLDTPPEAGSKFVVLEDITVARQIAEERQARSREIELANSQSHVTLESLFERIKSARTEQTLNVIIRADVRGSIEAIRKELGKLEHPEVKVKILQASVGGITEADVHLADASDAIIVGFNVVPEENARALAETKKVQIRRYDVIYKLTEDIRAALEGMLKPIEQVKELGRAVVQRAFNISRVGVIAGCRVIYGVIERDCRIRVIRDSRIIGEYPLETLKREKDDAREVREGYECGMKLKNFNDVKEGDVLEAYKIEEVARSFDESSTGGKSSSR